MCLYLWYLLLIVLKPVEVTEEVNSWAVKETSGLIKEILPPGYLNDETRLIFANALYFKGAWDEKFDASKTKEHEFHLVNGSSIKVPFMTSKKKQYISAFNGFKVLCLPYKKGEDKRCFSMYLFLPDAKDGLPALVDKVSSEPGFLERHLPRSKVKVGYFLVPKFKISFGFEASELLKKLGLALPFNAESGLTEMVYLPPSQDLCVSSIFHKSIVEVNEEGTEAAAASDASMLLCWEPAENFVANHPFLFLIREDTTGVVQFVGSVVNPAVS